MKRSDQAPFGMPGCIVMRCRRCKIERNVPFDHPDWPVYCQRCQQPMISHRIIRKGPVKPASFLPAWP